MTRHVTTLCALALIIIVSALLAASTWGTFGHTWDEPEHLAAGLELLDRGKYEYDTEHPPIGRLMIALGPYLAGAHSFGTPPPDGTQEGIDILYDGGHYDRTLMLARLGALPFLVMLLLAMWFWARQVGVSDGEALLGVLLLASVPPIIGHAGLAALDIPGTATTLLALYLLQRWLVSGARRDSIMFGLAAGVAVGTKLSAVPFIALAMIALALVRLLLKRAGGSMAGPGLEGPMPASAGAGGARAGGARAGGVTSPGAGPTPAVRPVRSWSRRAAGAALMLMAATLPLFLAYGRRSVDLTELPPRFNWVLPYLLQKGGAAHAAVYAAIAHLRLPEAFWDFAEGVVALKAHNDTGHLSFLLGHVKAGGWWYFYLAALAVKTPLPLVATGPVGMVLLARDGWRERNAWRLAPLVLFVTLLTFASSFSRINIGIRHVLILYPFMALGGAYTLSLMWRRWVGVGSVIAVGLVAWQLSTLWTANPDYFPYFNELVSDPTHVLVDSDLDWGQDLRRLERRLVELRVPSVSLAYQGTGDLRREMPVPFVLLPPWHPTTGWVALTALTREHEPKGYAWLDAYKPVERVGKTIDLYDIPAKDGVPAGELSPAPETPVPPTH